MLTIAKILKTAHQYNASDVYLSVGAKPALRIHDNLVIINEHEVLDQKAAEKYILEIMTEEQKKEFEQKSDIDFAIDIEGVARFRVNVFVQRKGIAAVLRLIPSQVQTLDDLKLPSQIRRIPLFENGIVILTGPTGCGKTTTLAALVNEINEKQQKHIITIEDPIEYLHDNKQSFIEQREVGTHTASFQSALRASLREDPDVILVGEMRDLETISLALTAAETGHLVLATLHTSGAAKSIDRIIDVFPSEQQNQIRSQLSESLKAVMWQKLLRTEDQKGRIAAMEILFSNHAVANMIRKNTTYQISSVIETHQKDGMQTMKAHIQLLLGQKLISEKEAIENMPLDVMGKE